jgi:hypothetical protein
VGPIFEGVCKTEEETSNIESLTYLDAILLTSGERASLSFILVIVLGAGAY